MTITPVTDQTLPIAGAIHSAALTIGPFSATVYSERYGLERFGRTGGGRFAGSFLQGGIFCYCAVGAS